MHPDLLALLDADDEAKRSVAAARRRLEEHVQAAKAQLEADRVRRETERAQEIEKQIRTIEGEGRQRAFERRSARTRLREARTIATNRAVAAGVDAYLRLVRGLPDVGREP